MKKLPLTLLVLSVLGLFAPNASAHMLETNYALKLDSLELEANLSNGESLSGGKIVVYAPNNPDTPWLEASTDEQGKFVFRPDPTIEGDWSIEIGEDSHWDNIIVPVDDMGIELEAVSSVPPSPSNSVAFHPKYHGKEYLLVLGLGIVSGIGSTMLVLTKKR
jgi:nickel transport protein